MAKNKKNLKMKDSDNDGLSDYDEINKYKTNPNNPDTDGDGIKDGDEIQLGLNPLTWDYIIPNKNNNYAPYALKPKRLFFYGVSALLVKVIVILVVASVPLVAFFNPDYIAQESKKIVVLTNTMRKDLNIAPLVENTKLTQAAMWKADDMAVKQYFSHIGPDGTKLSNWLKKAKYDYRFGGENLAVGFSTAENVMSAWYKSPSHYKNIIDPDFKEIGVGISVGNYNGYQTTFIAQYFGSRLNMNENLDDQVNTTTTIEKKVATSTVQIDTSVNSDLSKEETKKDVLGEKQVTTEVNQVDEPSSVVEKVVKSTSVEKKDIVSLPTQDIIKDTFPPILYREKTKIFINENSKKEYVVMAEVYLSDDTKSAELFIKDYRMDLLRDENDATKWTGHLIINDENITEPVISASLMAVDNSGNQLVTDIDWQNIVPTKSSLIDQYSFLKSQKNSPVNILFAFSMTYYKVILILAIVLLLINIFVEIKKQRIDIIASSVFLILFVALLILF